MASKPASIPARPAHRLESPDKFFAAIHPLFGTITQEQVENIQSKLAAFATNVSPMVLGMTEGWFTGKSFASYLPAKESASVNQFTSARSIINGVDRAEKVGGFAMSFQTALIAGRRI